jgi:predicted glycosyltransferase
MKILIDITHPAHAHLYKNFIWEMEKKGHEFLITARDKDVTKQLLDAYNIPYVLVGLGKFGKTNLILEWVYREIKIFSIAKNFNPDILMGGVNPAIVHVAKILGKKSIIFTDSEPEVIKYPIADLLTNPFADIILTLSSVRHDYGTKEVRVNSYKELAYLHPRWFTPNPDVLHRSGIKDGEDFVILRFVSWGAYHDVGKAGFDSDTKRELIKAIEPYARVFISSESQLPTEFEQYRIPIRPEQMHDFLYYAKLLICDSQTMTTEAAVLGTPAIRFNSFVGKQDMGNFVELEDKYGLIFNYNDAKLAMKKTLELVKRQDLKAECKKKKERLVKDKIDLTQFVVNYFSKDDSTIQNRMKKK